MISLGGCQEWQIWIWRFLVLIKLPLHSGFTS